jgi:hypothetical protein
MACLHHLDALTSVPFTVPRHPPTTPPKPPPAHPSFIRKAIGWVLRDTSRRRPELVRAYVARHGPQMSGLTRREATRLLQAL